MNTRKILNLLVGGASAILAGCGGGGGDEGGGSAPPAGPGEPLVITGANYVAVAQESLSSSTYVSDASSLATGAQTADAQVLLAFARAQTAQLGTRFSQARSQVTGVTQTFTEACPNGGSISISITDANDNGLPDAGDSMSIAATQCGLDGTVYSGRLLLAINSLTGNYPAYPYALSITLGFEQLTAQSPAATVTGNGTIGMTESVMSSTEGLFSLQAPSFSQSSTYGSVTYSRTLTGYELATSVQGVESSTTVKGTVSSSAWESKSVTLATASPFVRYGLDLYPSSGQATATGANGSRVRITVLSNASVSIELDADGDGSYEEATTRSWSELL